MSSLHKITNYLLTKIINRYSIDESTCCDEDFTWVCNAKEKPREVNQTQSFASLTRETPTNLTTPNINDVTKNIKPPRPSSLDRRRFSNRNRQERDSKSRSAHSLQESSLSTDFTEPSKGIKIKYD